MAEQKTTTKPGDLKPTAAAQPELKPAGEASNPAVHQLLADLATARANGENDEASDIVGYLAELGYSA